jgi:NAD(P)-dependent dehydrogenase (short-subunit alcohol dehydrogenase family)
MSISLQGGTAVVVGGAGTEVGLGRALVRQLGAAGMRVAIVDRDGDAASALALELSTAGVEAIGVQADVTDASSLAEAAEEVRRAFGTCNVLCAHVGGGGQGRISELGLDAWSSALDVMVTGTVATVLSFLPLLRAADGDRRIVLTSSVASLAPGRFQGPYRAAKAAVTSIGETLDLELGPEGIGTTIAFPSGMLPAEWLEFAREATQQPAVDSADLQMAIGREMAPNPADLDTPDMVAEAIIEGVVAGKRYVVSHGTSAVLLARERAQLLEDAFAKAAQRSSTSGSSVG